MQAAFGQILNRYTKVYKLQLVWWICWGTVGYYFRLWQSYICAAWYFESMCFARNLQDSRSRIVCKNDWSNKQLWLQPISPPTSQKMKLILHKPDFNQWQAEKSLAQNLSLILTEHLSGTSFKYQVGCPRRLTLWSKQLSATMIISVGTPAMFPNVSWYRTVHIYIYTVYYGIYLCPYIHVVCLQNLHLCYVL